MTGRTFRTVTAIEEAIEEFTQRRGELEADATGLGELISKLPLSLTIEVSSCGVCIYHDVQATED